MIPNVIHYCWFGHNPLPESAQKCISSWHRFMPDYEIKEWNENNFDVNIIPYTQQAYEAKKYAFVSDYARFWILYHFGGIYFDTDVEVIKPMDNIVNNGAFMGLELDGTNNNTKRIAINPGLGLGAEKKMPIFKTILEKFSQLNFYDSNGKRNPYSMIPMVTQLFIEKGLKNSHIVQKIDNINIYPQRYFNPFDDATGRICIDRDTYSIHWYSKTWLPHEPTWKITLKRYIRRIIR